MSATLSHSLDVASFGNGSLWPVSACIAGIVLALCLAGCASQPMTGETDARPNVTFTGQCLCGTITYRVEGPILDQNYCDCRGCQRTSGALRAPWIVVPRKALTVTAGTPTWVRGNAKDYPKCDAAGKRAFCAKCGTHLFWFGDRGSTVDLAAGALDDTSIFQPPAGR